MSEPVFELGGAGDVLEWDVSEFGLQLGTPGQVMIAAGSNAGMMAGNAGVGLGNARSGLLGSSNALTTTVAYSNESPASVSPGLDFDGDSPAFEDLHSPLPLTPPTFSAESPFLIDAEYIAPPPGAREGPTSMLGLDESILTWCRETGQVFAEVVPEPCYPTSMGENSRQQQLMRQAREDKRQQDNLINARALFSDPASLATPHCSLLSNYEYNFTSGPLRALVLDQANPQMWHIPPVTAQMVRVTPPPQPTVAPTEYYSPPTTTTPVYSTPSPISAADDEDDDDEVAPLHPQVAPSRSTTSFPLVPVRDYASHHHYNSSDADSSSMSTPSPLSPLMPLTTDADLHIHHRHLHHIPSLKSQGKRRATSSSPNSRKRKSRSADEEDYDETAAAAEDYMAESADEDDVPKVKRVRKVPSKEAQADAAEFDLVNAKANAARRKAPTRTKAKATPKKARQTGDWHCEWTSPNPLHPHTCTDSFRRSYDLYRHHAVVHGLQEWKWIRLGQIQAGQAKYLTELQKLGRNILHCPYCNPDLVLDSFDLTPWPKSEAELDELVFSRKDAVNRHIHSQHKGMKDI